MFKICPPPTHNILGQGKQHTIPTIHSGDSALLFFPQTPDSGPEPFQSRPKVVLHGLTKHLPRPGLCLNDGHNRTPLGLSVPVCYVRSPKGQKSPIELLLQLDRIPHCRCPPGGTGVATMTATDHLAATTIVSCLTKEARNKAHLDSRSPTFPGTWLKLSLRWVSKLLLSGDLARHSQQTLTIPLGLPGLTSILPHVRTNL